MPDVNLREATDQDAPAVSGLVEQLGFTSGPGVMAKRSVELRASRLFRAWVAEVHGQVVWAVNVSKPAELREKLWIWKRPGSRSAGCERTFDVRKRGTSMLPAIFLALGFSTMADDMIRGPIVVKEIRASHPRLFLNSAEIGKARERIRSSHGPWEVAWQRFRERVDGLLKSGREPQPYVGDEDHRFYYATVWRRRRPGDGVIARDLALAYVLSRDERYAEAAIAYLVAWANASPAPGGHMDSSKTPRGEPISGGVGSSVARGMIPFAGRWAHDTAGLSFNPLTGRIELIDSHRHGGGPDDSGPAKDAQKSSLNLWSIDPEDLLAGSAEWRFECTLLLRDRAVHHGDEFADGLHPGAPVIDVERQQQHIFVYAGKTDKIAGLFRITRTLDTPKLSAWLNSHRTGPGGSGPIQ